MYIQEQQNLRWKLAWKRASLVLIATIFSCLSIQAQTLDEPSELKLNVLTDPIYSLAMLEELEQVNDKPYVLLSSFTDKPECNLRCLIVSASVVGLVNFQTADVPRKFGWLGRQPADAPNDTKISEAVLHSVQLGLSAALSKNVGFHSEWLYAPSLSFNQNTNTDEQRNGVQVRKAYALWHSSADATNSKRQYFVSLGKMNVPFGQLESFSPFTKTMTWHAFAPLANGIRFGLKNKLTERGSIQIDAMLVQGGAQFRAANTPVAESNEPQQLNNFAWNVKFMLYGKNDSIFSLGTSYLKGTSFCQDFPVRHFGACETANPAMTLYAKAQLKSMSFALESASTQDVWPGTHNPIQPQFLNFPASKVSSTALAAKYQLNGVDTFSVEMSEFQAGVAGVPWSKQEQLVFGWARKSPSLGKFFAEYIQVTGFVPLNNISGGVNNNDQPIPTQSDSSAGSQVILVGFNLVF